MLSGFVRGNNVFDEKENLERINQEDCYGTKNRRIKREFSSPIVDKFVGSSRISFLSFQNSFIRKIPPFATSPSPLLE